MKTRLSTPDSWQHLITLLTPNQSVTRGGGGRLVYKHDADVLVRCVVRTGRRSHMRCGVSKPAVLESVPTKEMNASYMVPWYSMLKGMGGSCKHHDVAEHLTTGTKGELWWRWAPTKP